MIPCHDPSETSRWQREMDKGEKSPGPRVTVYSKANTVNEQVSVTARRDDGVESEVPAETLTAMPPCYALASKEEEEEEEEESLFRADAVN
jgi:hypothetical protein